MNATEQKSNLYKQLNSICDKLRKTMDSSEYRNYILGFIFFKFLSQKQTILIKELIKGDDLPFDEFNESCEIYPNIKNEVLDELGFFIENEYTFENWIKEIKNNEDIIPLIEKSLRAVEESSLACKSEDDFKGLFNDIKLASNKLGHSEKEKEETISHIILKLNEINFKLDNSEIDILGDAYEYLISNFASEAGKKSGEFYTPQEISKILAKIVTTNKKNLKNAYDPTCGSGSLLLQVSKEAQVGVLYGQEIYETTYNLARMNMFLHNKAYHEFNLKNNDTIESPQHKEDKDGNEMKFEAIVANPPFSLKWDASPSYLQDPRFVEFGVLAPKSKMDYAFIQHMLYMLSDHGIMATVVAHGVLFRGGAEGKIRGFIIKNRNWLDAVIGLPANIFFGTSIPACILVFRKDRNRSDKIIFIEASRESTKGKNQNILSSENIDKIVNCYRNKTEIDKYSKLISVEEIKENEFNLNITRYVDTFEEEEEIDIIKVNQELKEIDDEIIKTEKEIEEMIKELYATK